MQKYRNFGANKEADFTIKLSKDLYKRQKKSKKGCLPILLKKFIIPHNFEQNGKKSPILLISCLTKGYFTIKIAILY